MPAGTGPFGLGTPAEVEEPAEGDAGIRWLNPDTKDFAQDSDTRQLKQMPEIRHRVMMLLKTEFGSSTVLPNVGVVRPRKIGTGFERDMELAVKRALYQLTDVERRIRIDAVISTRNKQNSSRVDTTVQYTDLESGETDAVTVNG